MSGDTRMGGGGEVDEDERHVGPAEGTGRALEVRRDGIAGAGGPVPRVRAAGDLDAASSPSLVAAVTDAVTDAVPGDAGESGDPGAVTVVVDLEDVTFCDSRGLSALVVSTTSAARAGASLRLVAGAESAPARLLGRTGMTDLLPLHPDTDAALVAATPSPLEQEVGPGPS